METIPTRYFPGVPALARVWASQTAPNPGRRRDARSRKVRGHLPRENSMRMISVAIAALVAVSFAAPASAQMSERTRGELATMRAQNPASYDACHSLAVQRGYSTVDHELE